ncbi:hypothetical protein [Paracoccus sp. (in: a-proteobacteria)]
MIPFSTFHAVAGWIGAVSQALPVQRLKSQTQQRRLASGLTGRPRCGRAQIQPLFVSERTAAKLLDMKPSEFMSLVNAGALPRAVRHNRWDVAELQAIMRGAKIKPSEEFEL